VIAVVAVFFSAVPRAAAQEIPAVSRDTTVWVTTADRREHEGAVESISPSTLVLRVGATSESIRLADVRRMETRDSLRNGLFIGGIAGAAGLGGFGAYLSHALCEIPDGCFPQDLGPILLLAGIGAGAGMALGSLIDFAIKGRRLVYSSDGSSVSLRVAPVIGGRGAGVRLSVTWPP
jgi:hypothetical protein